MARRKRNWWQKKTNWAILVGVASQIMMLVPAAAPFAPIILKIAVAAGVYGVADRAGKPNDED